MKYLALILLLLNARAASAYNSNANCRDQNNLRETWSDESHAYLTQLLSFGESGRLLSERERAVEACITPRVLTDLADLYQRDLSDPLSSTYASFTVNERGADGGRGLHIVKNFSDGDRSIWINEEWPIRYGRLELPDEIRVRTRVFNSRARGAVNSEEDFISLRVRVAWNQNAEPKFFVENLFRNIDSSDARIIRRAPISNAACASCHSSPSPFSQRFSFPDTPINHESLVQPKWLTEKLTQSLGFQEFLNRWPQMSANQNREVVRAQLSDLLKDSAHVKLPLENVLANLKRILAQPRAELPELGDDQKVLATHFSSAADQDSYYRRGADYYEDAIAIYERENFHRESEWKSTLRSIPLP